MHVYTRDIFVAVQFLLLKLKFKNRLFKTRRNINAILQPFVAEMAQGFRTFPTLPQSRNDQYYANVKLALPHSRNRKMTNIIFRESTAYDRCIFTEDV